MQALYVAYRGHLEADIKLLETGEFVDERILNLVGEREWQKYLAGLYFNVKPERAMQVWIGNRVTEVLTDRSKDKEELRELSRIPGFGSLCEQSIEDNGLTWAKSEPTAIPAVAERLSFLDEPFEHTSRSKRVWRLLREYSRRVSYWPDFNRETVNGVISVLENTPPEEYEDPGKSLLVSARESFENLKKQETWDPDGWVEGFCILAGQLESNGVAVDEDAFVPGDASEFLKVVRALPEVDLPDGGGKYVVPRRGVGINKIIEELASEITAEGVDNSDIQVITHLDTIAAGEDWSSVRSAIAQRINQSNTEADISELEAAVMCLVHLLARKLTEPAELKSICQQQSHLLHRLHQLHQHDNVRGVAGAVLTMLVVNPEGNIQKQVGNGAQGQSVYNKLSDSPEDAEQIVKELSHLIHEFGFMSRLLEEASVTSKSLMGAVIRRLVADEMIGPLIEEERIIEGWDLFTTYLEDEGFEALIQQIARETPLVSRLLDSEFGRLDGKLYQAVLNAGLSEEETDEVEKFLIEGLRSADAETWFKDLEDEANLLELAFCLLERERQDDLGSSFRTALEKHRSKVGSGEIAPSKYQDRWEELLGLLEREDVFIRDTVDSLLNEGVDVDVLLTLYGDKIKDQPRYLSRRADIVVRRLFRKIIQSGSAGSIEWLRETIDDAGAIFSEADDSTVGDFNERLEGIVREAEDEDKEETGRIGQLKLLAESLDGQLGVAEEDDD